MAGVPGKKRARVEKEAAEVMEDESDGEGEEMEAEIIKDMFEFAVRKPESVDFDGIHQLLGQMFLKLQVNLTEMTDWIIVHNNVGSFLHQCFPELDEEDERNGGRKPDGMDGDDDDDDDDGQFPVLNIVTVVSMTETSDLEYATQLRQLLLDRCNPDCKDAFREILSNAQNRIALLINERYVNLPPQLCLVENLWKEIERERLKDEVYNFSHYLVIAKVDRLSKITKRKPNAAPQPERCFRNFEEEVFYKHALLSFEFSVKDQVDSAVCGTWNDDSGQYEPYRTVMIVAADKIPTIMSEMTALIVANGIEQGMQS